MKINNTELMALDVERRVRYLPTGTLGKISSWNSLYVFVRFHLGETAAACRPEDLAFVFTPNDPCTVKAWVIFNDGLNVAHTSYDDAPLETTNLVASMLLPSVHVTSATRLEHDRYEHGLHLLLGPRGPGIFLTHRKSDLLQDDSHFRAGLLESVAVAQDVLKGPEVYWIYDCVGEPVEIFIVNHEV